MRIRDFKKLTDFKWLNLFDIDFETPAGKKGLWKVATRSATPKCIAGGFKRPDAVVIVAYHTGRQRLVATKELRIPLGGDEYGFPAGLVDAGETLEEAARRELKEETGLDAVRFIAASPPIYSSAGMTDESVSMVYLECEGQPSDAGNQGVELIEVLFLSPSDAKRLCSDPALKFDAKAWLVLTHYGAHGFPPL